MNLNVTKEIATMRRMTAAANKAWLIRRIAWRLQVQAEGGLSERAQARAAALANDADLRITPPRTEPGYPAWGERATVRTVALQADGRLPPPGSVLTRRYKGEDLRVTVRADGFEFEGRVNGSLSAVAKAITGSHTNGFLFFRLTGGAR